jgi:hypothetical protein
MLGHRPSALPTTAYCAQSALLGAKHGAGRAAALSSAWHARLAGIAEAEEMMARLTREEQETVKSWPKPQDIMLNEDKGPLLSYVTAEKELPVGLDGYGDYCDPKDPTCLTAGTLDFAWVAGDVAYVADLKKSKWTSVDGPDSLQLQAYGWAFARKMKKRAYVTGLWIAETGDWQWSGQAVILDSPEGEQILDRIIAAASNGLGEENPPFSTGPHCQSCYARTFCPEHTLSAAACETWLEPVTKGEVPTPEVGLSLWTHLKAAQDVLKKAEEQMKAWISRGELRLTAPDGKILAAVMTAGRPSLDRERLEADYGAQVIAEYEKRGAPFPQFRWIKPKAK